MKNKLYAIALSLLVFGCQGFLDEKPQKSLVVPTTLSDLQALMDNELLLSNIAPGLPTILGDEMYLTEGVLNSIGEPSERNGYTWNTDLYEGTPGGDWPILYEQIFYANIILEGLKNIERIETNAAQFDHIMGSATFCRSFAYYHLLTLYCSMKQDNTILAEFGLVIKDNAFIESSPYRINVNDSYEFIENELIASIDLLQENQSFKTRPSKAAAFSLLARLYLFEADYQKAESAANSALTILDELLDYNDISPFLQSSFPRFNKEVIFHQNALSYLTHFIGEINPALYELYEDHDLRKDRFFVKNQNTGRITFKGSYTGMASLFGGITTAEMILILSECKIRNGDLEEGIALLNEFAINRYDRELFIPFSATNEEEALKIIIDQRRKELVNRGTRWLDLRRLNHDPRFQETLRKSVGDMTYELLPNDLFYILPIIDIEIETYSIRQNP